MTLSTLEALVKHWATFVKAHERLALIVGALLVSYWLGQRVITAWDAHDARNATIQQAKIDADETQNKALAQQLEALKTQVAAATATANAAIAQKHTQTVQQQKTDLQLPLPELASRWSDLLLLPPGELTASTTGITANDDAAHKTVNELEKIPDLTNQIEQNQVIIQGCNAIVLKQTDTINGLNVTLTDEKKARADDAKVAKDKEHKAWRNGFKWGAVMGFVGGVVTLHKF
jgi:hypothetical protein